ncbi:signal peptidase I [Oceanobacillus jordanicus]|uniref:Signal peptidase I n=1 Tax=Oceanobacillus jordanicus TaxID=2867266 RepID=A0AAW5B760_9BACI|nr:signal peptidase I [Oceanobacillus jordanicus]MCG3419878.1 signal peptidase I [Oceanobacillus jordanicus]
MKKVLKGLGNIGIVFLVVFILLLGYSLIQTVKQPGSNANVLGYQLMNVLSDSMDPIFHAGDMVVLSDDVDSVKVGDIITFEQEGGTLVTHRIISEQMTAQGTVYETKGDANNVTDEGFVKGEDIHGAYSFHIPMAGSVAMFLKSPSGLVVLGAIPLLYVSIVLMRKLYVQRREQSTN